MKLTWDEAGTRLFETGVSKGVLYPTDSNGDYMPGVAWSGLTSVSVSPEGGDPDPIYANGVKIAESYSFLNFSGSIEAYMYPDEFSECIGFEEPISGMRFAMQKRKRFGLIWKSMLGNDVQNIEYGYKIHILYGCMAQLSEMTYSTVNENPEYMNFSWSFSTIPAVVLSGYLPTSYIEFDSIKTDPDSLFYLEQIIYGTDWTEPRIPLPLEIRDIMTHESGWIKGIFAYLDDTTFPYNGKYSDYRTGNYQKYDLRKF